MKEYQTERRNLEDFIDYTNESFSYLCDMVRAQTAMSVEDKD